jgi:hypothetical protein
MARRAPAFVRNPAAARHLNEQYALGDLHIDGELAGTDFHIF